MALRRLTTTLDFRAERSISRRDTRAAAGTRWLGRTPPRQGERAQGGGSRAGAPPARGGLPRAKRTSFSNQRARAAVRPKRAVWCTIKSNEKVRRGDIKRARDENQNKQEVEGERRAAHDKGGRGGGVINGIRLGDDPFMPETTRPCRRLK